MRQTLRFDEPPPCAFAPPERIRCALMNIVVDTVPIEMSLPPGVSYHTPEEPSMTERRSVVDGGTSYDLTTLAPGLFEMRQSQSPSFELPADEDVIPPSGPRDEEQAFSEEPASFETPPDADEQADRVTGPEEEETLFPDASGEQATRLDDFTESEVALAPLPPLPVPVLAVNNGLSLTVGEMVAVTPEQLQFTGGEPCLLDVMILSAPLQGALVRDGFALTGGDVFTQEDIDLGRLHYRHDGGAEECDSFTFATPEGEVPATVFTILIEPTAPRLDPQRQRPARHRSGRLPHRGSPRRHDAVL